MVIHIYPPVSSVGDKKKKKENNPREHLIDIKERIDCKTGCSSEQGNNYTLLWELIILYDSHMFFISELAHDNTWI